MIISYDSLSVGGVMLMQLKTRSSLSGYKLSVSQWISSGGTIGATNTNTGETFPISITTLDTVNFRNIKHTPTTGSDKTFLLDNAGIIQEILLCPISDITLPSYYLRIVVNATSGSIGEEQKGMIAYIYKYI